MNYYIDLQDIPIDKYKQKLIESDLLPSRMILKEEIDSNFERIKAQHVQNTEEIYLALKTKKKLQQFAVQSGVDEAYLTILRRELNSYHPKPNMIKDFPDIAEETVSKLALEGITNTLQLFPYILTPQDRHMLAVKTAVPVSEIIQLAHLTDLSRIRWVNHTFAYVLYKADYDSAEKIAHADYQKLYEDIKKLNDEKNLYKGHIGAHDMKLCVEAAQDVTFEIVY